MEWQKITVILLVFGVIQCAAMALSEIEEFRNFLKQTSHLEETLKKGPGISHDDDRDAVSDHAWEESGKFEGDIILNERQRKVIVQEVAEGLSRNGLLDTTKRWPDNEVIYYIQREHFTSDQVQAIEEGMNDLAQASCIKFRPYKKGDRDAVVIQGSRRGCFSQVGYQSGYQVLNLSGRHPVGKGCFRHGTVVHELLHTLGFYHMQSSPDRDDYIDVLWENIVEPAKHNFRKYNTFSVSDFGVGYDYDSVLHYSRAAFSRNGRDTLVPKQGGASIGQRVGLSDKDTQKLNKMYCDAGTDDSIVKDEQTTQKSVSVKQKAPESKHFEGHGLGYHQGKTVIIKLTPSEAKTYKIPDYPTFHMFDYFSKAPETLSPTFNEDTETGKQLNKSNDTPYTDFISLSNQGNDDHNSDDKPNEEKDSFENEKSVLPDEDDHISYEYDKYPKEDFYKQSETDFDNFNNKKPGEDTKNKTKDRIEEKPSDKTDKHSSSHSSKENDDDDEYSDLFSDYNEEFERLGKIIKNHVYPSHSPNFDIYKGIGYQYDKANLEKPYFNSQPVENNEEHKDPNKSKAPSTSIQKDSKLLDALSDKLPRQFNQHYDTGAKIKQDTKDIVKHIFQPVKRVRDSQKPKYYDESAYQFSDEFDSYEHLSDKDYTNTFNPKNNDKTSNILKEGHSIIGYVVPDHSKRKQEQFDVNNESEYSGFKFEDIPGKKSKQAFKIIGLIVPITDDLLKKTD